MCKTAPALLVAYLCVCVSNKAFECCAPNFVSPRKSCGFYCAVLCRMVLFRKAHVALTQNRLFSRITEGLGVTYMKAVHDTFGNEKAEVMLHPPPFPISAALGALGVSLAAQPAAGHAVLGSACHLLTPAQTSPSLSSEASPH